ncbi:hypothetical protein [Pseudoxanthomonas composti]|uniref:DUF541 domain-containing protein n=1 Tax=Pseudoxanthomonas composti TaxID=2137479 RepID=A0A4V1N0S6_9GAMM|nr:hypothetical protein [Pseudoxanthomonas composti]RXR01474.1 hypothetical protein EPA99_16245 [Pseudoxanthomonas composti]
MNKHRWFACCLVALSAISINAAAQDADIYDVAYIQSNLTVGKTTRAQVLEHFGEPTSKKATLSSAGGASETLVYVRGAPKVAQKQKKGGGLGGMMASLRGVASDVAGVTGQNIRYDDRVRASRVEDQANAADRLSSRLGTPAETASASAGAATLSIQLDNGVVSSFDLQ